MKLHDNKSEHKNKRLKNQNIFSLDDADKYGKLKMRGLKGVF
jgi:hypothetical protein